MKEEKRKIRAYLITENEAKETELIDGYEELNATINSRCIDIQERYIGGIRYDFIIDDEGRLADKGQAAVSFLLRQGKEPRLIEDIRGAFIICKGPIDDDGQEHSLNEADITNIERHLHPREKLYSQQGLKNLKPFKKVLSYDLPKETIDYYKELLEEADQ